MIALEDQKLSLRFPATHQDASAGIGFERTLRVPDTEKEYPLPPGLGSFQLRHVDDYAETVPESWLRRGGVMMPLYQAEAMWISFKRNNSDYPFAIKIAAGKINAVTGDTWKPELDTQKQDYLVIPKQPWLDGFFISKDIIRQFVAMPLGQGYTAEEQLTGEAEHGGLQIIAYPMKAALFDRLQAEKQKRLEESSRYFRAVEGPVAYSAAASAAATSMGLAPGGRIRQEIYKDHYGIDAWDQTASSKCFVTLVDAVQWAHITGELPPQQPPTAKAYTDHGLPWFDYYADDLRKLDGSKKLAGLLSVAELAREKGLDKSPEDEDLDTDHVVKLESGGVLETKTS